jgi:hypothetical protein
VGAIYPAPILSARKTTIFHGAPIMLTFKFPPLWAQIAATKFNIFFNAYGWKKAFFEFASQ